ncbi:MAG: efflux RND transporter periplasmic adaptor subunit [Gammaproteobacteria bacterium]|nr:efflux RND transporter periplasmic adaptor subunit [Gammaproteobacteria bacterium]
MKRFVLPILIVIGGIAIAALLIITGPTIEPRAPQSLAPLVRVLEVSPKTVQLSTLTYGTVVPRTESELVPEVSGRIVEMSPAMVSGGFFSEGDLLISIDPLDYEVALEQAKAGLTRSRSDLANSRTAYERQLDLARKQLTSPSQRDDALNRLNIAEATLREARAKLARAERDRVRTRMIAPYDGRVRNERVDIGQFITRGTTVGTIYAIDIAEVRLPIHDEELAYLELPLLAGSADVAEPVKVTLRARFAGGDHEWQGEVVRTEGELDPQTRMINVIAQVISPYAQHEDRPPLSVGLFVEAEILGRQVPDVVVLPRSAIRGENRVFVIDSDNRLRFRNVDVLRIVADQAYVQGGLFAGERVCLSTLDNALDGMMVRLQTRVVPSEDPSS